MPHKTTISGKALRARLIADGYTIAEVAQAMGVLPQNIYMLFKSAALQQGTIERIANALGVAPEHFSSHNAEAQPISGKQLQAKLKNANIPISQLSRYMNVSPQNLYAIFKSKRLRPATIRTLACASGMPTDWFYNYETPQEAQNKDTLIAALQEIIAQQKKYIAILEAKLGGEDPKLF